MNRRQKDGLAELGVMTERYYVDAPDHYYDDLLSDDATFDEERFERDRARGISTGAIWGLAILKDGKEVAVVEQTPRSHDDSQNGRYLLKRHRTRTGMERSPTIAEFKTQREAVAGWLRREYRIAS